MDLTKISTSVQVISVVAGVVISVLSFSKSQQKEADVRILEAETRRIEALAPFYKLRQQRYVEIAEVSAILVDAQLYTEEEIEIAKKRFRALYIVELSMVESGDVEKMMVKLASKVDPDLLTLTPAQQAAFDLSHTLRGSFTYDK
jgi:hypothetical protein